MEPRYIAAIEIGSSKIKGIVAAVDATSTITVTGLEESPTGGAVRYGRVQNAREVSEIADDIIRRLENRPGIAPATVTDVFIANGGRSLSSALTEATVRQGGDVEVTELTLQRLQQAAMANLATNADVLAISARKYTRDGAEVKNIVGTYGNTIHGQFTFVTCSPENKRNLERVKVSSHGRELTPHYITRVLAQAENLLTDDDRQRGCLLIDFGAETTTLAVFRKDALQMVSALPMGSNNITRDLSTGLSITEDSAENIKITKGMAVAERVAMETPDAETREIINYVSARAGEIIANIINRLSQTGFKEADLPAGIVITGGGSRLRGFNEMLEQQTHMKVRPAVPDRAVRIAVPGMNVADNIDLIAMVRYAANHSDITCLERPATVTTETRVETPAAGRPAAATVPAGTPRRRIIDDDDPNLLNDDADEPLDDELPPQGTTPEKTRESLKQRFLNWLAPKISAPDEADEELNEE